MAKLTHVNQSGQVNMVDVGDKAETERTAVARGHVAMRPETLQLIRSGDLKKGDVSATARIAGIMAAKKTSELIPLCHPIAINKIDVKLDYEEGEGEAKILIEAQVRTKGRTGVEMEALTAVSVTALTIYDMAKAIDRGMRIGEIRVVEKRGGRSGDWTLDKDD